MKSLADLTDAAVITRKPLLEAEVQEKCVTWARARGYWCRKFSSISQRSVPDYLFSLRLTDPFKLRLKFFTEFKREGAKRDPLTGLMSTEAQIDEQNAMRAAGWEGFECNDFEYFKAAVWALEQDALES